MLITLTLLDGKREIRLQFSEAFLVLLPVQVIICLHDVVLQNSVLEHSVSSAHY